LLEFHAPSGDEIIDLLAGKKPNRESVLQPSKPRAPAVPPAGKPRPIRDWSRRREPMLSLA
jgi:cell division protease FtsH